MSEQRNPLASLAYFIVGLIILIVAVQVLGGLLSLVSRLVMMALTLVLLVVIGYVVWLILKAAYRSLQ